MAVRCLPLALLGACLACAQGFQRSLMEVVVPRRIPVEVSGNTDKMTFLITIEGTAYMVHLKRQSLLSNNFRVYTYSSDGSLNSVVPSIARNCYYQGYIEDFVNSVVALSTCMGLEGLLQFENATYGIEPMGEASGFQHLIYQLKYENASQPISAKSYSVSWTAAVVTQKPLTELLQSNLLTTRYLEIYIVLAHDLYQFWGAVVTTVTEKIIRLIGFVNAMFGSLYVNVILTSLEIWVEKDQIPTTGSVEQLLEKFAKWKQSHLSLRPHDVALLFV
ncbi:hypothetical protein lerEdw1_012703 [Lerista edwardsae]|nr:hypothetical protein lerEdw1_012703 [Lerista edwardsae]